MEGLTPHRWAGLPGAADAARAQAVTATLTGTKAAVAAASLLRFGHAVTAARSFVPDTELPDFDFPTWRVRHRPYDYETDGC